MVDETGSDCQLDYCITVQQKFSGMGSAKRKNRGQMVPIDTAFAIVLQLHFDSGKKHYYTKLYCTSNNRTVLALLYYY